MRLLRPAVLLAIGSLINPSTKSTASPLPSSSPKQKTVSIPRQAPRSRDLAAAISASTSQTASPASETGTIVIPPGTRITLALTSPIWAKTAKPGDAVYATTAFPIASNGMMFIPPGSYILGQIDALTKPGWRTPRALIQMHFSKIIFANGYTLELAEAPAQAATATVHVEISSRNDVLLDNGAQFDMVVETPLRLDASQIREASRRSRPPLVRPSASLCRPIPATPGTPDTVIPGTPGSPGTPDIVIPGPNGTSTVIPGIPPTPGTPPTIISGTPGTPELPCPPAGAVISGPSGPQIHRENFQVTTDVEVSGTKLSPGNYELAWIGMATTVEVDVQQNGRTIVRAPARVAPLPEKSAADRIVTHANPAGSNSITSMEFAGKRFKVIFD